MSLRVVFEIISALTGVWLGSVGCAHAGPTTTSIAIVGTPLTLVAEQPSDAAELELLQSLSAAALTPLARWGGLRSPTRIVVVPNHAALEGHAHHAYPWLRAWGRYDVVYLQAPSTWGLGQPSHDELRALLTHELTHCLMYQAAADPSSWSTKEIPLWFREGLASVTARQAGKRLTREVLGAELKRRPSLDPIGNATSLVDADEALVYAAAHWAVALLLEAGDAKVLDLLAGMRRGWSFPVAFAQTYGEPPDAFETRALAWLRNPGQTKTAPARATP